MEEGNKERKKDRTKEKENEKEGKEDKGERKGKEEREEEKEENKSGSCLSAITRVSSGRSQRLRHPGGPLVHRRSVS